MNLTDALTARYSCRAYRADKVPQDIITAIVNDARHTPSWCNAQPWQLLITDAETDAFREALYAHALAHPPQPDLDWPASYPGVYSARRRTCGWQLYEAVGVEKGDRAASARQMMENFRLFGAPHVALLTSPAELGPYGAMDCGGFVTAFCLAAFARGVATIPQAAVAAHAPFVRDYFDLPADRLLLCAISFGYADPDAPANQFRTERASAADIIAFR